MENDFDIKEEYKKLKANLPDFEKMNNDFELYTIKDKDFLIRSIRRKINEKIIFFCRIIEGLLYPTPNSVIGMHESKFFSEEEKKEIINLYKRLMHYERESLKLDINPNDKSDVKFINNVFRLWNEFKVELEKVATKMQKTWSEEDKTSKNNYFG